LWNMWFTCPKGKIENKLFSFIQAIQTRINQFLVLIGSNFWSVGPNNEFFVFPRSLLRDACSQKVSKNLKIVCAQATQTRTSLSAVRTFSPLGVKKQKKTKNPSYIVSFH
jgi:hypothetical protein